ncbi:MAG TPA: aspartyl/asparaginyl beta-hydroxylase domain-containing protein [Dehalococcoidia bacterium]|nr:aspartyl/asparaginyl beta-hydroxylase domain-containing protein [Dehalococcoidia bacterium]
MAVLDRTRIRDTGISLGAKAIHHLEGIIAWGSKIGDVPVFDSSQFPWACAIETNWQAIRTELDAVLNDIDNIPAFQELSKDQRSLTTDQGWKTYFFYAFGFEATNHTDRCPETKRWLNTIPGMTTAFFSIFGPGKELPPHRGAFKGIVRYHLGLRVPEPKEECAITIAGQVCNWDEGKSLIFDDTYIHSAWNRTDDTRVVLFVDFVRPLRFPANVVNWLVLSLIKASPFVKDAVANYQAWEAKLDLEVEPLD